EHVVVLRHKARALLHPAAAQGGDEALARAPVRQEWLRDRPGGRRDPAPPGALHGASDGEVAGRLPGRDAARPRPRDRHGGLDLADEPRGTAALLPAERRGLGRHALARHGDLPRALGDRGLRLTAEARQGRRQARPAQGQRARLSRARRARSPDGDAPDRPHPPSLREALARRRPRQVEKGRLPALDRERAPPAARIRPRPPDLMTKTSCHHCDEFSRLTLLRRSAAEAGRGLPVIEPGMPAPAGTGLDRGSFVTGPFGLALSVYGLGKLKLFEDGIARAASGPAQPVLVSVFLPGGADSLSVLYPALDRNYKNLRPTLALPESAGPVFAEDTRLHWHPKLQPFATLHAEGKVSVMPAIGYTPPDQSDFTSRHFCEVGGHDRQLSSGWMGRYLHHHGTNDNPLQGLSLDYQLQPSLASQKVPVASLAAPDQYTFGAPGVWGQVETRMLETLTALGAHRSDPFLNQAAKATKQSDRLRRQLAPFAKNSNNGFGSPVQYPEVDSDFPRQLSGLAAMLAAGLPGPCAAITAPGPHD